MADAKVYEYVIPNFLGGINEMVAEELLNPNETAKAQNMDIDDGNLSVAGGCAKYIPTPLSGGIYTLMPFYKENFDGTITSYLLASNNTGVYYYNFSTNIWQSIATGLQSGYMDYINYQQGSTNIIIFGNGKDPLKKWTGSGSAVNLSTTAPLVKSITLHYERVWGTGDNLSPNRVYWSDDLNPENWNTALDEGGLLDIPTWDGGKCIGLSNLFDNVVIFKTYNIWKIFGTYPREYQKVQVYSSTGAIAERSIVNAGTAAFFLAKDGIYVYNGVQADKISSKIDKTIANMNASYASQAVGVFYDNKYILAIPEGSSTSNNTIIEYDLVRQNFMIRRGISAATFLVYNDILLFANTSGYVLKYNSGTTYDGQPIDAYWETPYTDLGLPNAKKRPYYLYIVASGNGQMKFEYTFDDTSKTQLIDLTSTLKVIKCRIRHKGRRFKFKISNVNGSWFKLISPKIQYDVDID